MYFASHVWGSAVGDHKLISCVINAILDLDVIRTVSGALQLGTIY